MTQAEKRLYLIRALLNEQPRYSGIGIPTDEGEQKELLRALMNVRMPAPITEEYLRIESEYLKAETEAKGITRLGDFSPVEPHIYLWQGDITTLSCGAVVNAANSQLLGCFRPLHNCIDNCIHSAAGLELRNACAQLMEKQGYEEPTGRAKLTPGFNLPANYVLHTVGPIVEGGLTKRHEAELASCYRSCLDLAAENGISSVAFCCISTGVFGFPQERAAEIAVETVREYLNETNSDTEVIFNVFTDRDRELYRELLG
ncbi:MAG: protein-ADP-ribose hydrolase [Clostridia bacterium]|nr:protein-ADP-ribose hydrolase [Clostridia bacterium]